SFLDYYHYLRFDENGPFELDECVELINTHETYFFREQFQLDVFTRDVLPSLTRGEGSHRPLAFWSAGCSTGEEAYTIAILLREQPSLREWKLRVVGSDISRKVLDVARAGVYTESSFRTTSPAIRARYFEPVTGGYRVIEPVRRMCSFRQLNLLRTADYRDVGRFDVIFCRNVLMYLTPAARHQIVEAFHDTLTPGGFLLLGHSESLLNVHTRFETVQFGQDIVYQRPTGDAP
ncbi:MAG: protein-glutamate O-methyltransferase CheR, partial [Myxococcales bacterium]|nr:protein-glutamate O-methyltransferase CheR [Myxococcales bacterium]